MKLQKILGAALVAVMAVSAVGYAAEGDKPATPKADTKELKGVRLIKPYSDLKDLSAEQTTKLKEIHKKFSDQIKALEAQQKEEMTAVLTDAQKKELADAPAGKADKKMTKPAPAAADAAK